MKGLLTQVGSAERYIPLHRNFLPCRVTITFVDRDGDEQIVQGKIGDTLLDVAKDHDVDLEGLALCVQPWQNAVLALSIRVSIK